MKLDDQFEWDLDNLDASPEEFAEIYAQDLGLGGEFKYGPFIMYMDCFLREFQDGHRSFNPGTSACVPKVAFPRWPSFRWIGNSG